MTDTPETKSDKFKRLAIKRATKALKSIRLIGNLSDRGAYEYTEAQVEEIYDAIELEPAKSRARFMAKENVAAEFGFKAGE